MVENGKILLVLGGTLEAAFLQSCYRSLQPDCVIAADGAMQLILDANLPCDYGVGDFDTVNPEVPELLKKKSSVRLFSFPPQKDETDAQLALELAMELQPACIRIVGATGGRIDHMLGNLELLRLPARRGIYCEIADPQNLICLVTDSMTLKVQKGWKYVSFLSYTDRTEGICLRGFRYPLENCTLEKGSTLCISNEMVQDTAEVSIRSGMLYCIRSRDRVDGV